MSEPERLLQEGDDLTRSLLRSALDDGPSPHARRKAMVALGLSAGAGAAVTTAAATSTASTAAKASATAGLLKWIGIGVLGGVVTVGAVEVTQSQGRAAKAQAAHVDPGPASTTTPPPARAPEPRGEAPAEAPSAEPVATADTAAAKPAETPPRPAARSVERPSLADEIAAIDAARVAIGAGDGAGALRALDDHDRRFPGGALGQEATVLRIQALALRGDRATAARLGRAFLDAHPNSALAPRVRALLGDPPAP